MDNIIALQTDIQKAFRHKQNLIAIFFDVEKAYDTTWKDYILKSLQDLGLNGNILDYINNFLKNRKFRVKTNGCMSTERIQENGVPQGEILSVPLFLIAMNQVVQDLKYPIQASLFADDLVIYCKGQNIQTIQSHLQQAIKNLEKWSEKTGFKFSIAKTKIINFNKKYKQGNNPPLNLYGKCIEYVDKIKFLGIIFDKKLNWRHHIENLKRECNQRINIIKTLSHQKWGAHRESLLAIYKALVRSKLEYGVIAFGCAKKAF